MENFEITFTINLIAVLTGIVWYLVVCLALMLTFTIYTTKKARREYLYRGKLVKFWTRALTQATLLSPLFPVVLIIETYDTINSKRAAENYRQRKLDYENGVD